MVGASRTVPATTVDVTAVGETMALYRQAPGAGPRGPYELGYGGAETNVLTQCSRLGLRTRWVSSLGDDVFGEAIQSGLTAEGVEVVLVPPGERQTGLMVKTYVPGEDPLVRYYRAGSAAAHIVLHAPELESLLKTRILHVTGIFPALNQETLRATRNLMEVARDQRVSISLDINYRSRLWSRGQASDAFRTMWRNATFLFGGRKELELLFDGPAPESDETLLQELSETARWVILKKGSRGASAFDGSAWVEVPASPATVVDTVGAGDAFVGGFLTGHLRGWDLMDSVQLAASCGARVCENWGDWEGQITASEETQIARR